MNEAQIAEVGAELERVLTEHHDKTVESVKTLAVLTVGVVGGYVLVKRLINKRIAKRQEQAILKSVA